MNVERAREILDPEHRENYDGMEAVNEACRMGPVSYTHLTDASVMVAKPGDGPAVKPKEFCNLVASDLR